MPREIKHKFHLKSTTELVGLVAKLDSSTKKYSLDRELDLMRIVHSSRCTVEFRRLHFVQKSDGLEFSLAFEKGHVRAAFNEEHNNYLVLMSGEEDFFGKVYDYYLERNLPTDTVYTKIHGKLYRIEPHEQGFLVTDELDEEAVGFLTPRKFHLVILESRLEKKKDYTLLHITQEWVKNLVPLKEVE